MKQNNTAIISKIKNHYLRHDKLKALETMRTLPSVKYLMELQAHHEDYRDICDRTKNCYNLKQDEIVYNSSTNQCDSTTRASHTCIPGPFNQATSWIINWINTNN